MGRLQLNAGPHTHLFEKFACICLCLGGQVILGPNLHLLHCLEPPRTIVSSRFADLFGGWVSVPLTRTAEGEAAVCAVRTVTVC